MLNDRILSTLVSHPLGITAIALCYELVDEYSGQQVHLVLGTMVSEGLVRAEPSTAGVLYELTDAGRTELLALSTSETREDG